MLFKKHRPKIFCIGFNKTGTTTIESVLKGFGYKMGNQAKGEFLFFDWYTRDFKSIIKLCKTADAFQDIPFSLPHTFIALDQYFKDAKFILTERNSAEEWYQSLVRFHSKLWAEGKGVPTAADLKQAAYRYTGYAYDSFKNIYHTEDHDLYNESILKAVYTTHNYTVKQYFKSRPEHLLVINVSQQQDYFRLCEFLDKKPLRTDFPWENKTPNSKI
ncbi:sulfotransferase [Flavobacteriaceae bacterium LMO-SS05]